MKGERSIPDDLIDQLLSNIRAVNIMHADRIEVEFPIQASEGGSGVITCASYHLHWMWSFMF